MFSFNANPYCYHKYSNNVAKGQNADLKISSQVKKKKEKKKNQYLDVFPLSQQNCYAISVFKVSE